MTPLSRSTFAVRSVRLPSASLGAASPARKEAFSLILPSTSVMVWSFRGPGWSRPRGVADGQLLATKSMTRRLNSSACSTWAQWPQRLSRTARELGMCARRSRVFS